MRSELAATGVIMRMHLPHPATDLAALAQFYASGGQLEKLTSRVNKSALMVWQKLHLHLRELERRSHRLEDLRARVKDLSHLPPQQRTALVDALGLSTGPRPRRHARVERRAARHTAATHLEQTPRPCGYAPLAHA